MSRNIPVALLSHKRQSATTVCALIRIETQDGTETLGMTTLDRDVIYDDGQGELTYKAAVGFEPASIYSSADFSVDNTEFKSLVPAYDLTLDEYRVNSGAYNYAKFWLYEVNFEDLSMGHWTVMHGTLGEMRSVDGITLFGECRSLMDQLRKPLCHLDSLACRAKFGSQPGDERFPCGFNASTLWLDGVITSVGLENTRTFSDSSRTEEPEFFVPGLVQILSGLNAGFYAEVEVFADGQFSLAFPTPYPLEEAVLYRVRRDCNKQARDANKGCKFWWGSDWVDHFRGEPDIPVGDAGTLTTPGAGVGPGSGGRTSQPFSDVGSSLE